MKSDLQTRTLKMLADAYLSRVDLRVNPEYQRGTVWSLSQKQGLIDSLLRGYQIPLFYVHLVSRSNPFTSTVETTASIVDGQQRLAAIASYLQNEFSLFNPQQATPGTTLPVHPPDLPSWSGKKFAELTSEDQDRLLTRKLLVVEMSEDERNEVRDLFIRLQAGTPLTAQEKRDAWPGKFTIFIIRHAGKPRHPDSNPKDFFKLVPRKQDISVDDGDHYVDRLAETRKFFAGLAMTIMIRERSGDDFVDLKGKTINDFYKENLDLSEDEPAAQRVIRALDRVAQLPGFEKLRQGKAMPFTMAFHLALLVDSLSEGNYVPIWRDDVVNAFIKFQEDVAIARARYKETGEALPHYSRFVLSLSGSGSDTAEVIRRRHSFFLTKVYPTIRIKPRAENRCYGELEKEVIWSRDRWQCKHPDCNRRVAFREAEIHHIIEYTAGGETTLENGILICPECHGNRTEMQRLTAHFQNYVLSLTANPAPQETQEAHHESDEHADPTSGRKLRLVIHWRTLGVERDDQTIQESQASDSIVKLLAELIRTFGESIKQQLTLVPVIRYPLSANPSTVFFNTAQQRPFGSLPVPGTDLHFCPQSSNDEKITRLGRLFSRLALPDGRDFPPGSVDVSMVADSATARPL